MGRIYSASFEGVSIAAAHDFFQIIAAAGLPVEILSVYLGQYSSTASAMRRVNLRRLDTAGGTGGSSPTVRRRGGDGDGTSAATVTANNTSLATGGVVMQTLIYNDLNGLVWQPIPEERIWLQGSQRFVCRMVTGPSPSIDMSGTVVWAEHG